MIHLIIIYSLLTAQKRSRNTHIELQEKLFKLVTDIRDLYTIQEESSSKNKNNKRQDNSKI